MPCSAVIVNIAVLFIAVVQLVKMVFVILPVQFSTDCA